MLTISKENEILVWIRPTQGVIQDGEVVFLNGYIQTKNFEGLASLRDLAIRLGKPVVLCAVKAGGTLLAKPRLKIESKSTDQELEKLAKEANASLRYMALSVHTHLGFHQVPTFYVNRP